MTERTKIDALRSIFARAGGSTIRAGIGDDAAVLSPPAGELVVTVDEQVSGTHFERDWLSLEELGWRATMAAASDVAAMAATPWVILAALVLPESMTDDELRELARGQADASDALGAPIVGGNLARGPVLSIATTVLGVARAPVLRSGARVGDGLYLSGDVGLAGGYWRARLAHLEPEPEARAAWARPRARIAEGLRMHGLAHAAIDLSDGLARDASHLAEASAVRIVFEAGALDALVSPALARAAAALALAPRALILGGGEDYALLAASPVPLEGFVRVGSCVAGRGVVVREGDVERAVDDGFDHFA